MRHTCWIVAMLLVAPGLAGAQAPPRGGSEAGSQQGAMGPATGNTGAANNGVGTDGSLDHDAGKATSTVTGVHGGTTSYGGTPNGGHAKPAENQPSIGGGDQKPK